MSDSSPDPLDIHAATPQEREDSFRNTHDVWSRGMPLDEHVAWRLNSPLHGRAEWFVGTLDGRVVTSLACHPLEFQLRGRPLRGFGIGSVHTLAAHRRRRLAPRLIAWVERHRAGRGDQLSVLFSDIAPDYYARLGYLRAPTWRGWFKTSPELTDTQPSGTSTKEPLSTLVPFDGRREREAMAALYAGYHSLRPLSITRNNEYWSHLFERQPNDEYFWMIGKSQERLGYVRLHPKEDDLHIADFALHLEGQHPAVEEIRYGLLCRLLKQLARDRGNKRIGGWLPDLAASRTWFHLEPRRDEITMFKPLDSSVVLDEEAIQRTDSFCELDHV